MNSFFFIYCYTLCFQCSLYKNILKRFTHNTNRMIKSLSGLLQQLSFIPIQDNPNSIIDVDCGLEDDCEINTKCQMIIPGYMEHDSKLAAQRHLHHQKSENKCS